ncbi:5,6-dimethylbenzimidazole synthase [Ensifer sp. M14]|uniref:5,6-dimethylbenzimidazole synthase n=1 Tax=Ensifer sp. M14 TaxID=2203782 RepID=UPI0018F38568|nr:5,6-dimethylbenzimidazole synthase [Ensifer sp. M14]
MFTITRDIDTRGQVHEAFLKARAEAELVFPDPLRSTYRALKLEGIMEAPVNICIDCDRDRAGPAVIGRTHIRAMDLYSTACAVQNLWLAARAEGLGVGWVSIFDNGTVQRILKIPKRIVPIAYLCVGQVKGYHERPELEKASWRERLPIGSLVHFEEWGRQDTRQDLISQLERDERDVREHLWP